MKLMFALTTDSMTTLVISVFRATWRSLEFYIVPWTGVFTTDTRLNTGLRQQRRPELDGDLERVLHRAQLDAHLVSSVAVLRLRQQVVVRSRVVSLLVLGTI